MQEGPNGFSPEWVCIGVRPKRRLGQHSEELGQGNLGTFCIHKIGLANRRSPQSASLQGVSFAPWKLTALQSLRAPGEESHASDTPHWDAAGGTNPGLLCEVRSPRIPLCEGLSVQA